MADLPDEPRSTAVEQLEEFGLSTYAARTFVALSSLGKSTASDVSKVADVPRTRVYDAVEELHEEGLVDIQQSKPKRFWPISAETAARKFEQELQYRTKLLTAALGELEPPTRSERQSGVWTVTGRETVTERVLEFFRQADEEIVYMTVAPLLTEAVVDELRAAADRGVSIRLAGMSPEVEDRIQTAVPEAELFDSLWLSSDTPAGRLLLVDGTKTLVSVRTAEAAEATRSETAIWGSGETNSLVVVLKAIFTWQLDSDPA